MNLRKGGLRQIRRQAPQTDWRNLRRKIGEESIIIFLRQQPNTNRRVEHPQRGDFLFFL